MALLKCQKCGRMLDEKNFYTKKDKTKARLCKQCMTMHIDVFDPSTFEWLLEEMDVPYLPGEWNVLVDKQYKKDGTKMSYGAIFGKYLSKMKLGQWNKYGYADSKKVIEELNEKTQVRDAEMQSSIDNIEEIERRYTEGKISKAQYMTLVVPAEIEQDKKDVDMSKIQAAFDGGGGPDVIAAPQTFFVGEDEVPDLVADLTEDDKKYLLLKWGRLYKPSQWIELERNYREMENSFDIQDQDTRNSLILSCKTYLKANEALDVGDVAGYRQLMQAYDQLRKSAKFTAVQNKEEHGQFIDSIGQLVLFAEREKGRIRRHDISTTEDILDKEIADMKRYYRSIIDNDPALSREIENYLKKKENAAQAEDDRVAAEADGLSRVQISDEDLAAFKTDILEQEDIDNELG